MDNDQPFAVFVGQLSMFVGRLKIRQMWPIFWESGLVGMDVGLLAACQLLNQWTTAAPEIRAMTMAR